MNWYGMEIPTKTLEGLWARDIKEHISFMHELGFNTLRIPFTLQGVLDNWYDQAIDPSIISACTSCPVGVSPFGILDLVMEEASAHQINVILDLHRLNFTITSPAWYTKTISVEDTFRTWDIILDRYIGHPAFMAMDLYNEPHGTIDFTQWNDFIQGALVRYGDRLEYEKKLILINGIHWGEDMRDFKNFHVPMNWKKLVILSPHSYGPTLTYVSPDNIRTPGFLFRHWETYYGYLAQDWPIIIGEWGGNQSFIDDQIWMTTFVDYMKSKPFIGSCFWAWNPNSQDVRGYLLPDWSTPDPFKYALIQNLFSPGAIRKNKMK